MLNIPEKNIVSRIIIGDFRIFEYVFRKHYEMLCRYAIRIINDGTEAEEIVQDLFYSLWEKRQSLKIDISLKSYLFAAVHNRCMKYIRHRNVEEKYRSEHPANTVEAESPETYAYSEELNEILERTLKSLPQKCSTIFRMNRFEGLKYSEIAAKLSVSVKTVEANMGRALKILRKNLKDYTEVA